MYLHHQHKIKGKSTFGGHLPLCFKISYDFGNTLRKVSEKESALFCEQIQ